jgi:hypothetical protein
LCSPKTTLLRILHDLRLQLFLNRDGFPTDFHNRKTWIGRSFVMKRRMSSEISGWGSKKISLSVMNREFSGTITGAKCERMIEMTSAKSKADDFREKRHCRLVFHITALSQSNSSHKEKGTICASLLRQFCRVSKSSCQWLIRECEPKASISRLIIKKSDNSEISLSKLEEIGFVRVLRPLYSPNLAPSNDATFGKR